MSSPYKFFDGPLPPYIKIIVTVHDLFRYCATWAKMDECKKNPSWMLVYCPVACEQCKGSNQPYSPSQCFGSGSGWDTDPRRPKTVSKKRKKEKNFMFEMPEWPLWGFKKTYVTVFDRKI
jgi:hypothetical protein